MHDTSALQWFSFSRNDLFVFMIEKRVSGRDAELIFNAIYLTIFCPLILVRKVHILAKNSVPRVFHIRPRVFHQTQRFPPDPAFPTPRDPAPWPRVFHLAVDFSQAPTQTPGNHHLIMKNAPHITTNAPRIMMANKAPHIILKLLYIMTKPPHTTTKAPSKASLVGA